MSIVVPTNGDDAFFWGNCDDNDNYDIVDSSDSDESVTTASDVRGLYQWNWYRKYFLRYQVLKICH